MISMQVHAIIFAFVLYWHDLRGVVFSLIYFVIGARVLAHRSGLLIASIDECISKASLCHSSSLLTAYHVGAIR